MYYNRKVFDRKVFDREAFDGDVNTFTPEGRVLQVEYANEASKMGATSIGICTIKGVVLAAEKRQTSRLMVAGGLDRIVQLDRHIGCTMAGMMADARNLIDPARMECAKHGFKCNERIPIEALVHFVARKATQFGMGGNATTADFLSTGSDSDSDRGNLVYKPKKICRPYGTALLFAGMDLGVPHLWHLDPSGELTRLGAKAIGSGGNAAQTKLVQRYNPELEIDEAKHLALSILEEVMGQKLNSTNLEMMVVTKKKLCHKLSKAELELELATGSGQTET